MSININEESEHDHHETAPASMPILESSTQLQLPTLTSLPASNQQSNINGESHHNNISTHMYHDIPEADSHVSRDCDININDTKKSDCLPIAECEDQTSNQVQENGGVDDTTKGDRGLDGDHDTSASLVINDNHSNRYELIDDDINDEESAGGSHHNTSNINVSNTFRPLGRIQPLKMVPTSTSSLSSSSSLAAVRAGITTPNNVKQATLSMVKTLNGSGSIPAITSLSSPTSNQQKNNNKNKKKDKDLAPLQKKKKLSAHEIDTVTASDYLRLSPTNAPVLRDLAYFMVGMAAMMYEEEEINENFHYDYRSFAPGAFMTLRDSKAQGVAITKHLKKLPSSVHDKLSDIQLNSYCYMNNTRTNQHSNVLCECAVNEYLKYWTAYKDDPHYATAAAWLRTLLERQPDVNENGGFAQVNNHPCSGCGQNVSAIAYGINNNKKKRKSSGNASDVNITSVSDDDDDHVFSAKSKSAASPATKKTKKDNINSASLASKPNKKAAAAADTTGTTISNGIKNKGTPSSVTAVAAPLGSLSATQQQLAETKAKIELGEATMKYKQQQEMHANYDAIIKWGKDRYNGHCLPFPEVQKIYIQWFLTEIAPAVSDRNLSSINVNNDLKRQQLVSPSVAPAKSSITKPSQPVACGSMNYGGSSSSSSSNSSSLAATVKIPKKPAAAATTVATPVPVPVLSATNLMRTSSVPASIAKPPTTSISSSTTGKWSVGKPISNMLSSHAPSKTAAAAPPRSSTPLPPSLSSTPPSAAAATRATNRNDALGIS